MVQIFYGDTHCQNPIIIITSSLRLNINSILERFIYVKEFINNLCYIDDIYEKLYKTLLEFDIIYRSVDLFDLTYQSNLFKLFIMDSVEYYERFLYYTKYNEICNSEEYREMLEQLNYIIDKSRKYYAYLARLHEINLSRRQDDSYYEEHTL